MSQCAECGAEVDWVQIKGRWYCHNAGTQIDHWDACSKRKWQQVTKTGARFEGKVMRSSDYSAVGVADGFAHSIHGTKLSRHAIPSKKGDKFRTSEICKNCIPPWEACGDCPLTIPKEK
jgi:hypothetical protein